MTAVPGMNVVVVGAGYVGCVTSACLARLGHRVTAVDTDPFKVAELSAGRSPVLEPGLPELIVASVRDGRLRARAPGDGMLADADAVLLCVATPSLPTGAIDTRPAERVVSSLARDLAARTRPLPVIVRMTITPDALRGIVTALPEAARRNLRLCVNPEFLREATAIKDFEQPPFVVIGGDDPEAVATCAQLYAGIAAPVFRVDIETAALLKYACNAFHGVKIAFANEIATLAERLGADPVKTMNLFVQDRVLNVSPAYLRPGFAFGGSCLPKDLRALVALAAERGVEAPVLRGALASNAERIRAVARNIVATGARRLAMLGLSFKSGTDDLRESPYLLLARELTQAGIAIAIFDPDVRSERLLGANREYAAKTLSGLAGMLRDDLDAALQGADGVIACKRIVSVERLVAWKQQGLAVFDLEYLGVTTGADLLSPYAAPRAP